MKNDNLYPPSALREIETNENLDFVIDLFVNKYVFIGVQPKPRFHMQVL